MNRGCEEGSCLRKRFEKELLEWAWFDAYEKAIEIMPVGLPKIHEFQSQVRDAELALLKSRHAYVQHMAQCLVCSRNLVMPDAVTIIHEQLNRN